MSKNVLTIKSQNTIKCPDTKYNMYYDAFFTDIVDEKCLLFYETEGISEQD